LPHRLLALQLRLLIGAAVRQQVGGVVCAQHRDALVVVEPPAQPAERLRGLQEILRRAAAERTDELRGYQLQLPFEAFEKRRGSGIFAFPWLPQCSRKRCTRQYPSSTQNSAHEHP